MEQKYQARMSYIGGKIWVNSRNELYLAMRFLDYALNSLSYEINLSTTTIATDGEKILYHPNYVLGRYQDDSKLINRMYLHMLFHCMFRHMMYEEHVDLEVWNVACDIAVESIIDSLDYRCVNLTISDRRHRVYEELNKELKVLNAEGIYQVLKRKNLTFLELRELEKEFKLCDHSIWERLKDKKSEQKNKKKKEKEQKDSSEDSNPDKKDGSPINQQNQEGTNSKEKESQSRFLEEYVPSNMSEEEIEDNWKDITAKVKTNMESMGINITKDAKGLLEQLIVDSRERYDYKEFLRKFSIRMEEMKVDLDSFDYIYYSYGLTNYDNMPFIEPLEYKEVNKIEEFVIVIDTSGSCSKELIHKFLYESYTILTMADSIHKKINIYMIQCDEEVQEAICIRNQDELEEYIRTFTIKGQGGTDFTKAFDYIDRLLEQKVFHSLKGMLYFTDGNGIYPRKAPSYDVAFVFMTNDYMDKDVPTWAMKLLIEPGGL